MIMKYKWIKLFTFIVFFAFLFHPYYSFADDLESPNDFLDILQEIEQNKTSETTSKDISSLNLNARSAIVLDRTSQKILYGKNEFKQVKMASTTKIMTATVILETCNLSQTIEVSKKAANTGGSRLGLKTGDKITIRDLLYGLMLCSGNDAAVALAETAAGSVGGFSDLMNEKARELGLTHTHFESPHGLDSDQHYTTAYELAILSNYALKNTTFLQIVGTKNYTVTINGYPKNLSNTNELLGYLNGVYGVKTGFTNGANRCLVTACKRGNLDIICVVLGCDTKKFRTSDSIKLIEYVFENFEYVNVAELIDKKFTAWKNENLNNFIIDKAIPTDLEVTYSTLENNILPILKSDIPSLEVTILSNQTFQAPVLENTKVGKIEITSHSGLILERDILINHTIEKKNMHYYFTEFLKSYSSILNSYIKTF